MKTTTTSTDLSSLGLFGGLSQAELDRLAAGATTASIPRGTIVFRAGQACTGLYFVISGQLKLALHTDKGQEKVLQLVGEGESVGEAALFLARPHLVTAEAIMDTTLIHVAKEAVLNEASRNLEFNRRLIKELSRQIQDRTSDLQSHMLPGRQRVVGYLLSRLPDSRINGHPVTILLPAQKGIIACRLNLTHEHFSRILHELASEALIEVKGRTVYIPDVHRLRADKTG